MKSLFKKKSKSTSTPSQAPHKADPPPSKGKSTTKESTNWIDESKVLTYEDLQLLSNNFNPANYLGRTQFGHLYKGIIPQGWKGKRSGEVTIKLWTYEEFHDIFWIDPHRPSLVRHSMEQEIKFLQRPDIARHPYTANVMGYCFDDNNLGVVYDLKPFHTLKNYIDNFSGEFGWVKRVSVALKLAYLLKHIHERVPEYVVRNLCPLHVMLDQDLNPILIDYAMIHGGSFVELLTIEQGGSYGMRGYCSLNELHMCSPTKRSDIHAYGVILLEIMRQCTYTNNKETTLPQQYTDAFAWEDYVRYTEMLKERSNGSAAAADSSYSFVHESMRNDPNYCVNDGNKISILGLRCVEKLKTPPVRSMGQVLRELKELKVIQRHPELLE